MNKLYIGLMSGTSLDGVDASLIKTDAKNNFESIADIHLPYLDDFKERVKKLSDLNSPFFQEEQELTDYHVKATNLLLKKANLSPSSIEALGFHGQSIFHDPKKGITWQIGNPYILAQNTKINVVHDFRTRDVTNGGQGAPLVPIFHKMIMNSQKEASVIINIGGVANLTYIDGDELIAFDTGPGNALIDDMMLKHFNLPFDKDGKIASSGRVVQDIASNLLKNEYFSMSYPKSLDRNNFQFLNGLLSTYSARDAIANLTYITSSTIAHAIISLPKIPKNIFICGGGSKNKQMINWINDILLLKNIEINIKNISSISKIDPDYVESCAFGYLAARFLNNLPSSFPNSTGVKKPTICGNLVKFYN